MNFQLIEFPGVVQWEERMVLLTGCVLITGCSRGIGLELVRQLVGRTSITPRHIIATCRSAKPCKCNMGFSTAARFGSNRVLAGTQGNGGVDFLVKTGNKA